MTSLGLALRTGRPYWRDGIAAEAPPSARGSSSTSVTCGRLVPMAESTDAPTPADTGYVLNFPTDGTSFGVRENLVDIVERELLGPIHGEDELLPFSPKQMYLVGLIAPVT